MNSEEYCKFDDMVNIEEKRQKEAYIQSLKNGSTREAAAEAANTCTSTVWNWRQRDEEFAKAEQVALESRIEVVVDALYQNAAGQEYTDKEGKKRRKSWNVIAQIFYAKNRGKGKWTDKHEVEIRDIKTINIKHFIQAGKPPVIKEEEEPVVEESGEEVNKDKKEDPREEIETVL